MEDVVAAFLELLPIASEQFSLEFVPETVNETTGEVWGGMDGVEDGNLRAMLRSIMWDVEGGARQIRDVKEQMVVWLCERNRDDPRVRAYLEGWAAALRFVFARHEELRAGGTLSDEAAQRLECSMPSELLNAEVLDLRRPQTADDFTDALLSSKKRLGKLLP